MEPPTWTSISPVACPVQVMATLILSSLLMWMMTKKDFNGVPSSWLQSDPVWQLQAFLGEPWKEVLLRPFRFSLFLMSLCVSNKYINIFLKKNLFFEKNITCSKWEVVCPYPKVCNLLWCIMIGEIAIYYFYAFIAGPI